MRLTITSKHPQQTQPFNLPHKYTIFNLHSKQEKHPFLFSTASQVKQANLLKISKLILINSTGQLYLTTIAFSILG